MTRVLHKYILLVVSWIFTVYQSRFLLIAMGLSLLIIDAAGPAGKLCVAQFNVTRNVLPNTWYINGPSIVPVGTRQ